MPYKDLEIDKAYKRKYYQQRRDNDPEYAKGNTQKWRTKNPKQYILSRTRVRSKAEGIPCTITKDDFEIPAYCPIFPELKLEFCCGRSKRPDNTPTIDRIIPELGYIPGNVAIISMRANRLKSDASAEELETIAKWIRNQTNGNKR